MSAQREWWDPSLAVNGQQEHWLCQIDPDPVAKHNDGREWKWMWAPWASANYQQNCHFHMPGFKRVSNFATRIWVMLYHCVSELLLSFIRKNATWNSIFFPSKIKKVHHPTASFCLVMLVFLSLQRQNVLRIWSLLLLQCLQLLNRPLARLQQLAHLQHHHPQILQLVNTMWLVQMEPVYLPTWAYSLTSPTKKKMKRYILIFVSSKPSVFFFGEDLVNYYKLIFFFKKPRCLCSFTIILYLNCLT